ncbi:MAG: ABC transporter permease [Betaproteobacteria bacterium]
MKYVVVLRWSVIVLFVALLEALCRSGLISRHTMIPPTEMAVALAQLIAAGTIRADATVTLRNVAAAFAASVVGGFVLGVAIHALPRLRRVLEPLFASYYAVPTFVFYPVLLAVFGMNDMPIIVIGTLFGIVAMIVATLNGLDRIPRALLKTARVLRMSRISAALRIQLPAIAPHLFTGVKLAIAYSFIGVIAAEFILSDRGLGYAISYAYNNFENRKMYALMLLIIVIVSVVNAVFRAWELRLARRRGLA